MRAKSRSTMHEVKKLRSITDRWSSRSRATRLMPESQGFHLLRRLRLGGVSKTRLNSCTSRGGVRALSIKHVWERPGRRALICPVCTDVTLPRFPPPTKGRAYAIGKATSSSPRKTVRRDLESARAKVAVFLSEASLFHPGFLGFFS